MARHRQRYNSRTVHMPREPEMLNHQSGPWKDNEGRQMYRIRPLCGDEMVFEDTINPELPDHFRYSDYQTFTTDPLDWRVCSRCQAKALHKLYGGKIETYKIGERVDLSIPSEKVPHGISKWTWKSVYPVIDTAVLADADDPRKIVGFICIENGWGKAWEIHGWSSVYTYSDFQRGKTPEPKIDGNHASYIEVREAYTPYGSSVEQPRTETKKDAKGIASKEAALLMIPDMLKRGLLKPYQACLDFDILARDSFAQTRRDQEEARVKREQESADRMRQLTADKGHVEKAFRAMIDDETLLSNFQREGVFMAAKMLGIDLMATQVEPRRLKSAEEALKDIKVTVQVGGVEVDDGFHY